MGDYVRWAPPFYEGADRTAASALFLSLNRNKRSIRVDLKSEQGREVLLRLARDADVLLESFRPGVLDRLGVGYEALREVNPGLVYCAITGYGQDGPLRDRAGHDMNYLGRIGLLGLSGDADGPPVQAAGQIADLGGGALMAAFGILAALRERDRTRRGPARRRLDGRRRALVAGDGRRALLRRGPRAAARRARARRARCSATGPYRCSDGWVTLGALEPKFWQAWCRGVGREDLVERQFEPPGLGGARRGRGGVREPHARRVGGVRRRARLLPGAGARARRGARLRARAGARDGRRARPAGRGGARAAARRAGEALAHARATRRARPGPALGARHRGGAGRGRLRRRARSRRCWRPGAVAGAETRRSAGASWRERRGVLRAARRRALPLDRPHGRAVGRRAASTRARRPRCWAARWRRPTRARARCSRASRSRSSGPYLWLKSRLRVGSCGRAGRSSCSRPS